MKIDREISCTVLTDNFCLLYGEKFRQLFENNGQKLINLGIENAKKHFTEYAINNTSKTHLSTMVRFFKPNKEYSSLEEMKSNITEQLKPFLSIENILKLFNEREYSSFNDQKFAEPIGIGIGMLQSNIIKGLGKSKPNPVKTLNFNYFKQFPIYNTNKSVNLATEGGLGLDQFNYSEVKYYLEENEEFYLSEAIAYKYHGVGSVIGREELRTEMVDKIKKYITNTSDYSVKQIVKSMLDAYCFGSEEDSTLLDIQTVCGIDGLQTSKQLNDSIKNIDPSIFTNLLNENKIKKFKDF